MKYDSDQKRCVFCNNELEILDDTSTSASYPPFKGYYPWQDIVMRYTLFGLLVLEAAAIILKIYLFKDLPLPLLVLVSGAYIYFTLKSILSKRRKIAFKVFIITILTAIETSFIFQILNLGIMDIFYEYVFPGLMIICLVLQIVFLYVFKKSNLFDNLLYCLFAIILGCIPSIAMALDVFDHTWLGAISLGISLLFLIWLILFERKPLIEELRRRLHI
jgi:hypothetical protein